MILILEDIQTIIIWISVHMFETWVDYLQIAYLHQHTVLPPLDQHGQGDGVAGGMISKHPGKRKQHSGIYLFVKSRS